MSKLRVGVIGVGKMAEICHLPILADLPQVKLVAFCDTSDENLAARGDQYDVQRRYTSHYDLFDNESLDAVCIFIPPYAHTDAEIIAAERGIHVFVEKPPALTMQKAHEANAAIQQASIISAVGFNRRYSISGQAARAMLDDDCVVQALIHRLHGSKALAWWWMIEELSGGPFVENTIHSVDLLRYLGAEYLSVTAHAVVRPDSTEELDIPLSVCANYTLAGGGVANIATCSALDGFSRQGFLVAAGGDLYDLADSRLTVNGEEVAVDEPGRSDYRAEFASFFDAILYEDPSRIRSPYSDAVKSLAAALAAVESAHNDGMPIDLTQPPYSRPLTAL